MKSGQRAAFRASWPAHVWLLTAVYFAASLAHFTHNAEFIALYPGLPAGLSRADVYLAGLAVTGVGAIAAGLAFTGRRVAASLALAAYGALGLDGLLHYTLALCSEHTLLANVTIWGEALAGVALACAAVASARNSPSFRAA